MEFNAVGVIAVSSLLVVWGLSQILFNWKRFFMKQSVGFWNKITARFQKPKQDIDNELEEPLLISSSEEIDVAFSGITVPPRAEHDNCRVFQLHGHFPTGKLTAIMGPSGCGKVLSTLFTNPSSPPS